MDIKDNIIILRENSEDIDKNNYIILNTSGQIVLNTKVFKILENEYLVKNNNQKMVLLDNELNEISKEYDKIITNSSVDISAGFSSYSD